MKSKNFQSTHLPGVEQDKKPWAPITKMAECFGCSANALRNWGRAGSFGCKQIGPKLFIVCIPEAVEFYTDKYPNIEINHKIIDSLVQSTV